MIYVSLPKQKDITDLVKCQAGSGLEEGGKSESPSGDGTLVKQIRSYS